MPASAPPAATPPSALRRWGIRGSRLAAWLALACGARAHQVLPHMLELRPGGYDFIAVVDLGGCPATIRAASTDPSKLKVYAVDMLTGAILPGDGTVAVGVDAVEQIFLVQASVSNTSPLTEFIDICWIGSDFPDPPCNEDNCPPHAPHVVPVTIDPMPLTSGASLWSAFARDPVNAASGELVLVEEPDLDLGGILPLKFERYYASRQVDEGDVDSALGPGWAHNYDWRLVPKSSYALEVVSPTGRVLPFVRGPFDDGWSLAAALDVPYRLVQSANAYRLGDPLTGLTLRFDALGRLDRVSDANGNAHTLAHGPDGPTSIDDGLGRELTLSYVGGRLTELSDGTRGIAFAYDGADRLAWATDAEGATTSYAYDASQPAEALLTARMLPEGNTPYVQTWDNKGRVATQADASGHTWSFSYVPKGTTTVTDPKGKTNVYRHDAAGRLTDWTDEAGQTVQLGYDADGRRASVLDRKGAGSQMSYHGPSGKLATVSEAGGALTTFAYEQRTSAGLSFFDLVSVVRPGGNAEAFTRDAKGNLLCWTDPAAKQWDYAYGLRGEIVLATDPKGKTRSFAYNPDLTLSSVTDEDGEQLTLGYDALRRVTSITQAGKGSTSTLAYDLCDRVVGFTDEAGAATTALYDDNGRLGWLMLPGGGTWTLAYDGNDALSEVTDPLGHTASVTRDAFGRPSTLTDGGGVSLDLRWDLRGRFKGLDDALGLDWTYTSDGEGLKDTSAGPGEEALDLDHDERGNWTRLQRGLQLLLSVDYDPQGDASGLSTGDGAQVALQRDARRLVSGFDLPLDGASTQVSRDSRGYVVGLATPLDGKWSFGRDARGFLGSITDPLGNKTQYQRNARGWAVGVTWPGGLGSASFDWSVEGLLTRRFYSDGIDISYGYDAGGRLDTTYAVDLDWDLAGRLTGSNGIVAQRDGAGRLTSLELAPGKLVEYGWGLGGELRTIQTWFGAGWSFDYDAKGRRKTWVRPNGIETRYSWNLGGGLASIFEVHVDGSHEMPLSDMRLNYDLVERLVERVRETWFGPLRPQLASDIFGFDAAARLNGSTYDAMGRTLDDGSLLYEWDLANRLRRASGIGLDVQLDWNGLDAPISIFDGSQTLDLQWNYALEAPRVSAVYQAGSPLTYYVHTPDGLPLASVDADTDEVRHLHYDDGGSVSFVSDDAGEVVATSAHDAYGQVVVQTGFQDTLVGWRGASGALSLRELGLHFEQGRFFDPKTLRYLQPDSRTGFDPIGSNPYALDGGDPASGARDAVGRALSAVEEAAALASAGAPELDLCDSAPAVDAEQHDAAPQNVPVVSRLLQQQQRALVAAFVRWSFFPLGFTQVRRLPNDPLALLTLASLWSRTVGSQRDPLSTVERADRALLPPNATQAVIKMRLVYVTALTMLPRALHGRRSLLDGADPALRVALLTSRGATVLSRLERALELAPRNAVEGELAALSLERPEQLDGEIARVPLLSRIPILAALFAASPRRVAQTQLTLLLFPHLVRAEEY